MSMSTGRLNTVDVIDAIQRQHLQANIADEERAGSVIHWAQAHVDPGGTIFGPGPYLRGPVTRRDGEEIVIRVYAPARLRRQLAAHWVSA